MDLQRIFTSLGVGKVQGTIQRRIIGADPKWVKGKQNISYDTAECISFFFIPEGESTLAKRIEIGDQGIVDGRFYFSGSTFVVGNKDLITTDDGIQYEIYRIDQRRHGNFTFALGKFRQRVDPKDV